MKNKKGFTLIELLAVIVILAIIMVIAVPRILDVINSSRNSAASSSIGLLKKGIRTQITSSELTDINKFIKDSEGCYEFDFDNKNTNYNVLNVENKEKFTGTTKYCNGTFIDNNLTFDGNTIPVETKTYLYKTGNEYTTLTGGWTLQNFQKNGRSEKLEDNLHIFYSTKGESGSLAYTTNQINLDNYSKIYVKYRLSNPTLSSDEIYRTLTYDIGSIKHGITNRFTEGEYTDSIDVSDVTGSHQITFSDCDVDIKIYEVWLER